MRRPKGVGKKPLQILEKCSKRGSGLYRAGNSRFDGGNGQFMRDEAIRSYVIAAQTIMLAVKSLGYDSCPMVGFEPKEVGNIIGLPEDHVICMMIAIGKAVKPAQPRGGQLHLSDVVITDHF